MITLQSPIDKSKSLIGYTVLAITDRISLDVLGGGNVSAQIRLHYHDGSYEDTTRTLWDGVDTPEVRDGEGNVVTPAVTKTNKYADAGEWTTASAAVRIVAEIK